MPSQWDLPEYLRPDRNDPTQLVLASMQMGAAEADRKRQFMLQVEKFKLDQQQANLNMAHTSLLMQHQKDLSEDAFKLGPFYKEISNGNVDAEIPELTTMEARINAENTKVKAMTTTAEGQARNALMKDYATVVGDVPDYLSAFEGIKPFTKAWTDVLGILKADVDQKREARAIKEYKAKQDILFGGREELVRLRNEGTMEAADRRLDLELFRVEHGGGMNLGNHMRLAAYKAELDSVKTDIRLRTAEQKNKAIDAIKQKYGVDQEATVAPEVEEPSAVDPNDPLGLGLK